MIVLHSGAALAAPAMVLGLFHVAIHVPSRHDLGRAAARLATANYPHSGQDHLLTESLYLADPDGNGIELAFETPQRGRVEIRDGNPLFIANDGSKHSGLEPLDVGLLAREPREQASAQPLPANARVGHIHMRTRKPDAVIAFYTEIVGLKPNVNSRAFGMYDVGTVSHPHLIAFNTWGAASVIDPPPGAAGLESFTIEVPGIEDLMAIRARLRSAGIAVSEDLERPSCTDPEGNRIRLSLATAR